MELEINGTGGIYPGNSYHSTYLPQRYQDKTDFQIFDVIYSKFYWMDNIIVW